MKQETKRTVTPKLRFPEFKDSESWQTPQFSDLYSFKRTNTLSRDNLNYETGTIRNIHYGDIHTKFSPLFRIDHENVPFINPKVSIVAYQEEDDCEEGDIVLADASEDLNDVGKAIEIVSLNGQRVVAGTHTILATRLGGMPIVGFGGHLFQSERVRLGIQRESQGSKVYGISANRISTIVLPLPPTKTEQKKIADCLGSLDALIAAEGRKLEALRDHKRGLMQQLFPQPGETKPRLRFPEFREKGEWVEKVLSDACLMQAGKFVAASDIREQNDDGLYPCYGGNGLRGFTKSKTHNGTYPLIGRQGALCGNVGLARGEFHATEHAVVASPRTGVNAIWLFYMLNHLNLNRFATGQAQPGLSVDVLEKVNLSVPALEQEQQQIAGCLAALDSLIAAQMAKIETLKQHKSGLMKQLFPSAEAI